MNSIKIPRLFPPSKSPTQRLRPSTRPSFIILKTGEGLSVPGSGGIWSCCWRNSHRLAKEHRFQFVLVAFPVRAQVETTPLFDYPQQRLRQIARALKVPCLDLLPLLRMDFEKNKKEEDRLFFDHCHLTNRGHQVVAQAVYRFLKQTPLGMDNPSKLTLRPFGWVPPISGMASGSRRKGFPKVLRTSNPGLS